MASKCNTKYLDFAMKDKLLIFCVFALSLVNVPRVSGWTCENSCGGVAVQYPFGTGKDCGSAEFQNYVNCTKGKLRFYTPTGTYSILSIDYENKVIIINDPHMSTCSSMQNSYSFGLAVGSPFTIVSDTFVLIGCSSTSSLYNSLSGLCDPSATQICKSLYSCPSVTQLGIQVNGPTSSCCVYSNSQLNYQPFQINLPLLQCSSYTSIYSFGPQYSYGTGPSSYNRDASTWSYGIALKYSSDETGNYSSCYACQQTNGACGFNIYGFVCVCSEDVTTTTHCHGYYVNAGSVSSSPYEALLLLGVSTLLGRAVSMLMM